MSTSQLEPLPRFLEPMLATNGSVPDGHGWAAEVKWDGLRGQLRHDGRRTTLRSRNGHDLSSAFPELVAEAGRRLGRQTAMLDAEIVCLNADGRPDFGAVRARMHSAKARDGAQPRSRLVLFDVLHVRGRSTRSLPYHARRSLLDELDLDAGRWIVPAHFVDEAAELAAVTRAHGLEGVVSKRLDAPYLSGRRSTGWVKHKHRREQRVVVLGCRASDGRRPETFLLGREDRDGHIRYAGEAAFGLSAEERERVAHAIGRRRRHTKDVVRVVVAAHGEPDGLLRDAVMLRLAN
jgi:bifunctional non-homologous end joining protein LigD